MIEDRIKLALAMKAHRVTCHKCKGVSDSTWPGDGCSNCENTGRVWPDPFTSADDDYAVLEWMRRDEFDPTDKNDLYAEHERQVESDGRTNFAVDYKIGDYARASLKVINDE